MPTIMKFMLIYTSFGTKLESDKAMELLVEAEKRKIIKKSKIKQRDSVFEFNRKERSIKNRISPKKSTSYRNGVSNWCPFKLLNLLNFV